MITITTPNTEKIYFKGTSIEITNIFCRLQFNALPNGKEMIVNLFVYENEAAYLADSENIIELDGVVGFEASVQGKTYDLSNGDDPETWKAQTITVAHDQAKAYLDSLNYLATISGI
jgi:hypothetical protein